MRRKRAFAWRARRFPLSLNFSLNFCVSLKQAFLPNRVPGLGLIQMFPFALTNAADYRLVSTQAALALRSAALGAAFVGMARDKYFK